MVDDINSVERAIEEVLRPQTALNELISRMFSGNKRLSLSGATIEVETNDHEMIGVAALSAGEKQVLRLLMETLIAGDNSFLVDEPEISLHIDWQNELIGAMRSLSPSTQLIVATHSPEVMAEVDDAYIHRL